MSRMRLCERDVVAQLLKNLDLPHEHFALRGEAPVISLCLSPAEWATVTRMVSGRGDHPACGVDAIGEAWRELPPHVWTDEAWIARVCVRFCAAAPDYQKLILSHPPTGKRAPSGSTTAHRG